MNLDIGPWQIVWPRVVVIVGLSMLFAPLNVAAFVYIAAENRGAAVGLLALLRNEGGSVGTSVAQTISSGGEQFHTLRLNESLYPFNPNVSQFLHNAHQYFLQQTGDPVGSREWPSNCWPTSATSKTPSLSYFDIFTVRRGGCRLLVFAVLLMKSSKAEKGQHIGAESSRCYFPVNTSSQRRRLPPRRLDRPAQIRPARRFWLG